MPALDMFCMKDAGEWLEDILSAQESAKGISILEITERVQDPNAGGASIRPSSPRTVEAFLQSGIDPEDLVYKSTDYFSKRCGGNEELAREAFAFFDAQRLKRIEEIRSRRQALIDEGWKPEANTAAVAGKSTGPVGDTEDMVEKERKRLEVLRKRQEQELQQLVDYELKRAQIQAKAEEKLAKQEARSMQQLQAKAAKEAQWRALQREQELKRLAEEQEEERKAKEMEKVRFRKEQEFLAAEKIREKEMRKEAYRKEQERIQKAEQARMETEAILERQMKEVEARKREMQRRDEERRQAQLAKATQLAAENEEKRIKADARLKAAFDANIQILERKRQEFYQREKEAMERRKKQDEERLAADEMKRKMLAEKAEKRKEVFNMAQKRLDDRIQTILHKAAEQEASMRKEMERREKALSRKKLHRQLNMEYRMECVDTNRKQQLYQREQLLHRIQAETDRIMRMQRDRNRLQLQRKEANMQASMARQAMVENMDRLQQAKKFDKIATGEITLESLMAQ